MPLFYNTAGAPNGDATWIGWILRGFSGARWILGGFGESIDTLAYGDDHRFVGRMITKHMADLKIIRT